MAVAGAWAFSLEGRNTVRGVGRTFAVAADVDTIGLSGDGGAGGQLPAGWVATSAGSTGADFSLNGLTAAQIGAILQTRTIVKLNFLIDPTAGVAASVGFQVTKNNTTPWRITMTLRGTLAGAAEEPEVTIQYLWSGKR